ncbi:Ubiquitin carboxyl-terminal hydrolase family protein [Quillaja saponaria]|uniref:Ubiquitin carboxyl-terminal hydrolase family protein n=1 Tax=Quillaja saponaria TaxID=32244 RepID=A0AAD7L2I6_QUISA|nr:Ubiquitin carboxyl-terminal hydrolase family protein [Quillaja saponaria]
MKKAEKGMWIEEKGAEEDGKEEEGKGEDIKTKEEGEKWAEDSQVDDNGGHKDNEGDQNRKPDSPSHNLDKPKSHKMKGIVPSTSEPSKLDRNKKTKVVPSLSRLPSTAPSSVGVDLSFTWQSSQGVQVTRTLSTVTTVLTQVPTMHTESPTPAVLPLSSMDSHLLPTSSSIQMATTIPFTPITDMAMFRGLGPLHKKFIPLLEEAMSKHPELWTRRPQEYSNEFSLWGFHALGRVLEFLWTIKIRDITFERKREFSRLWLELGAFGFDLTWLEPSYREVMTCSFDEPKIKHLEELKGEMNSLAKDLREKVAVVEDKLVKVAVVEDKLVKVMTEITEASKNLANPDHVIDF